MPKRQRLNLSDTPEPSKTSLPPTFASTPSKAEAKSEKRCGVCGKLKEASAFNPASIGEKSLHGCCKACEYSLGRRYSKTKVKQASGSDLERRDALVMEHLEWATGIARHVARTLPTWFTFEDLIGPVEIALCQVASKFDPSRGVPFTAFAQRRIYGACYSSVRRKEYRERAHISLDASTRDQTSNPKDHGPAGRWQRWEATAGERDTQESPDDLIAADKAAILGAIWHLPSRHQKIITLHYLRGFAIQDIARQMGLSSPRISQLHREALAMLRPAAERMR